MANLNAAEIMEREAAGSGDSGSDYQVFLSFRGPDTRNGFTDCLYHFLTSAGIRVFKDDTDHPLGAKIDKILDAIDCSVVCIPIFSKTYAWSKWCLRELTRMVALKKTVFPIFYDVVPNDVKLKTGLYADALKKHAETEESAEEWTEALLEVGRMSGRELKSTGYGEFCLAIVSEVLAILKTKDKIIAGPLVAIKDQVEAVMKLLHVDSPDVRFVGIHGMGGIGKTTLAKLVFNELSYHFQHCSFIDDTRELSKSEPTKLQIKLLGDTIGKFPSISDTDHGIRMIRDFLCKKKVLIVLDDVDETEQINTLAGSSSWFGLGSRIIITTRYKSIIEQDRLGKVIQYEMAEMNYYQALQLFSNHAFKKDHPPTDYLELSKDVVSVVGRLPLAIEIIGSHLHGKHKDEWRQSIRTLARIPHKDVQKKLKLSYNSLDYRAQQIFLDIACFFNNKDKTNAMYMWEACNLHPESAIEDLISMSLIKIMDHDKLWMHDQLRDLGREIVRLENFFDFGKRSRLWEHKEAIAVLKRREGTRKVQALSLSEDASCFGYEELQSLRNLRFLEWHATKVRGDLKHVFSKLIWFSWHFCPTDFEATGLYLESLVILVLSRSNIDEKWAGWNNIQVGDDLKVLDLTGCKEMTRTPNFSTYRTLERLILEDCGKLAAIDGSVGSLKSLKFLNLKGCCSLSGFPNELCYLDALEVIIMEGEGSRFSLPELIGNLRSLLVLEMVGVQIYELPRSIGELAKLKRLSLVRCSAMKELPESIGMLNSLVELDLSKTDIVALPSSIGGLKMLKLLYLKDCEMLENLPDSLGDLKSLAELDLTQTRVTWLPDSVGNLCKLRVLKVVHTKIKELPRTIGKMVKLEELYARGCDSLNEVSRKIRKLPCLRILDLSGCSISKVPSLSKVSSLQTLLLQGCDQLKKLPKLPESLTTLDVASPSLQRLPDFSKLEKLSTLKLSDRKLNTSMLSDTDWSDIRIKLENLNLEGIDKLTKLSELVLHLSNVENWPTNFSTFAHLKVLSIACPHIQYQIPQLPPTLTKLHFLDVKTKLPSLGHLKKLVWLEIEDCSIEDGLESLGMEELYSLASFSISSCGNLRALHLKLPQSLENLWLSSCNSLETIPDLSELQNLQLLDLYDCNHLTGIAGLDKLKSLEILSIAYCGSLGPLLDLSGLRNLKSLKLWDYGQLSEIFGIGELESLQNLTITSCNSLKRLSNLSNLTKLEELEIDECGSLIQIEGISNLSLRKKDVRNCVNLITY